MPLREAIQFLKGAVARNLSGGAPSTYRFHDGIMYAESPAMLAAYPVPHIIGTFAIAADPLEAALGRMPVEPAVSADDGTLILRAGRLRSSFELFPTETPEEQGTEASQEWGSISPVLWPALVAARPFVAKEGSWQCSVCLTRGRTLALSNVSCIEVQTEDIELKASQALLVDDCLDYLIKLPPPERWREVPERALWFGWANGAWVRCRQSSIPWAIDNNGRFIIDRVLEAAEADQASLISLSDEWREAFADIAALGDGDCYLNPEGMIGRGEHDEHHAELMTGVVDNTKWSIKALAPIIAIAAEWCPDAKGPALFRGENMRGAVVGKR